MLEENPVFSSLLHNPHGEKTALKFVVRRLEVELKMPEHAFITQDEEVTDENGYMFFIVKGDCSVTVKDKIGEAVEEGDPKILGAGDHFGVSHCLVTCRAKVY